MAWRFINYSNSPAAKPIIGAMIQPDTMTKNGHKEMSLVLYDMPVPKRAADKDCVFDRGILSKVASSTRTVEVKSVIVAFE